MNSMTVGFPCIYLCLFLFAFDLINSNCFHQLSFSDPFNNKTSKLEHFALNYSFLEDSGQCDDFLNTKLRSDDIVEYCPDEFCAVDLIPHSVFPVAQNILPYVQLNVSFSSSASITREVYFRIHCLFAPNTKDYLCHNHNIQVQKWGRMIWPCRRLQINTSGGQQQPEQTVLHFHYTCYQLFSLSQYAIDFFVIGAQDDSICRRSLLVTIPLERHLDPKIDNFYSGGISTSKLDENLAYSWSPLLFVDASPADAVIVYFRPVDWLRPTRHINLSIFSHQNAEEHSTEMLVKAHLLVSERIKPTHVDPAVASSQIEFVWRWTGIEPGQYTIYGFFEDGDCQLVCQDGEHCKLCTHTALNLTIDKAKYTMGQRRSLVLISVAKHVAVIIFGILILLLLLLLSAFIYMRVWRPRAISRLPPRSVQLTSRPTVLVLYTDDCQAHCDTVLALCRTLEESANARCLIDQQEFLEDSTLRPSIWLTEKLAQSDFVLCIFSKCSPNVLTGKCMSQRRHFPDLFNTAIGFVVAKINEMSQTEGVSLQQNGPIKNDMAQLEDLRQSTSFFKYENTPFGRYIFARFSYSPADCIPPFFTSTQFGGGPLLLPEEIGHLIARLHGIQSSSRAERGQFEHQANLSGLRNAIEKFLQFEQKNSDWMAERFASKAKKDTEDDEVIKVGNCGEDETDDTGLENAHFPKRIPTLAEQAKLAELYGLLASDEENGTVENDTGVLSTTDNPHCSEIRKYELVGKPEDFESSCSSIDEPG